MSESQWTGEQTEEHWISVLPDGTEYGRYNTREEAIELERSHREFMTATIAECIASGLDTALQPPAPATTLIHRIIHTQRTVTTTETTEPGPSQENAHARD